MDHQSTTTWHTIAWQIAAFFLGCTAWLLIIFGTFLCIDTFIPKSEPVPSIWPEFAIGVALFAFGCVVRAVCRGILAHRASRHVSTPSTKCA